MFGGLVNAPMPEHIRVACNDNGWKLDGQTLPTWVGEWSVAWKQASDGAQFEPYPDENQKAFMKEFVLSQMKVYKSFFFWNFRTDANQPAYMWDYLRGVQDGWLPPKLPHPDMEKACTPDYGQTPTRFETVDWPTEPEEETTSSSG